MRTNASENAAWQRGVADAHHAAGRLPEAAVAYRRALALAPNDGDALWGLGCALTTLREFAEAADCLNQLVKLAPDWGEAQHNLGRALHELGQTDAAIDAFRAAAMRLPSPEMSLGAIATIIPGAPAATNKTILEARRALDACAAATTLEFRSPSVPEKSPGRLRIGYVSSFFQDRNWMKQVWALINHHDRVRVEVHLFSDAPESAVQGGYRRHAEDRFHDISPLANPEAARVIASQGIDVLIDLNGYSKLSRMPLFYHRPAPVIIAWYNMYATTGLSCFDFLIGDDTVVPPADEPYYTERILRVPGSYLPLEVGYTVPDVSAAAVSDERLHHLRLPGAAVQDHAGSDRGLGQHLAAQSHEPTLLKKPFPGYAVAPAVQSVRRSASRSSCFGYFCIPSPQWDLGYKTNRSRMIGKPTGEQFLRRQFERFQIDPDRIRMEGPAEHFEFLSAYGEIDVALDTFPYNGGTTTMESLWQGVPVLCFRGDRWASRISASIVGNAGMPEFVAADRPGYIDLAVRLANDPGTPAYLSETRLRLRDHLLASPLCDINRFARNMEDLFWTSTITSATASTCRGESS